jgi:L-alanine-DL-glutamate epimerase-like enolase superfamily enzyme
MKKQIEHKINNGFHCLKLKIGNLDFEEELELIRYIRNQYSVRDIELRVDANGAYSPDEVPEILKKLADFDIHSIEQPILPSQLEEMASLCESTPLPIALDEELIGKYSIENKHKLLSIIRPQYIVIKPGLLGGIESCEEWVKVAKEMNIGWWITSSLESNIGLNAISQWTYTLRNPIPHGLSTGALFENNIDSPLLLTGDHLHYTPNKKWKLSFFSSNNTDYED